MTVPEKMLTMLRATSGVVSTELLRLHGISNPKVTASLLRNEGHRIEACRKLGYRLVRS